MGALTQRIRRGGLSVIMLLGVFYSLREKGVGEEHGSDTNVLCKIRCPIIPVDDSERQNKQSQGNVRMHAWAGGEREGVEREMLPLCLLILFSFSSSSYPSLWCMQVQCEIKTAGRERNPIKGRRERERVCL